MSRRTPTAGQIGPYIDRQLGEKYEVVQFVKNNMEMLQRLANIDLNLLIDQLTGQHFQDVTAVTVAADQPARWHPLTKVLEIPAGEKGQRGEKGEAGKDGLSIKGEKGKDGKDGRRGYSPNYRFYFDQNGNFQSELLGYVEVDP